jgi:integrase
MAEAVKTESGKWLARAHVNGKCRRFTRRLKKDAEKAAETWEGEEEARAKAEKEAKSDKYAQTFKTAIDNYISRSDKIFSPATVRDYRAWQRALEPMAGYTIRVLLEKDNQIIAEFLNGFSVGRSSKTVHCIYRFIVLIMRSVDKRIQLDAVLPPTKSPAYHIPEDETIRKFLDAAKGTEMEKAVLLAAFGSLRRSEVSALVPDDFDEKAHTVSITKACQGNKNSRGK